MTAGPRRFAVVGNSGSGKTTLASAVADRRGVTHIELDALMHNPGWVPTPHDEFLARVEAALDAAADGWVTDGNYRAALGGQILDRADAVVWLDLPLRTTWPRLWARTLNRLVTRRELYNGNREELRNLLSVEHPLWWTLRTRRDRLRTYEAWSDARWVRLRSSAEVTAWLASLG